MRGGKGREGKGRGRPRIRGFFVYLFSFSQSRDHDATESFRSKCSSGVNLQNARRDEKGVTIEGKRQRCHRFVGHEAKYLISFYFIFYFVLYLI